MLNSIFKSLRYEVKIGSYVETCLDKILSNYSLIEIFSHNGNISENSEYNEILCQK